jgi:hypothetical protein
METSRHTEIPAVAEAEVDLLLRRIGVADTYAAGHLRCAVCASVLKTGQLAAVAFSENNDYRFCCSRLACMEDFYGEH